MESLGLQGLRVHQTNSQESTTKSNNLKTNPHSSPVSKPTNSSQSDTLQVKSPILVIQTDLCYILFPPNSTKGKPSETSTNHNHLVSRVLF